MPGLTYFSISSMERMEKPKDREIRSIEIRGRRKERENEEGLVVSLCLERLVFIRWFCPFSLRRDPFLSFCRFTIVVARLIGAVIPAAEIDVAHFFFYTLTPQTSVQN